MATGSPATLPAGAWVADARRSAVAYHHAGGAGRFADVDVRLRVGAGGDAALQATVAGAGFAATAIRRDGDLLELDGQVTLNGRTLAVTGSGAVAEQAGELVVTVGAVVDVRQFGLQWRPPGSGGHEVAVRARVVLVRET